MHRDAGKPIVGGKVPVVALSLLLITFAGIRYGTGSDYFLYTSLYRAIIPHSLADSLAVVPQELGWVTLSFLLRGYTNSPYLLLWLASIMTIVPVLIAIRRQTKDPTLAVFLFFFLGYYALTFNAVRQSIAVSFLLLADSYRQESRLKCLLFSAIAVLFHSSALIAILVQLIAMRWKPTWVSVVIVLALGALGSYFLLQSGLAGALASSLNPRYETYLDDEGAGLGTWLVLAVRILLIVFAMAAPASKETSRYIAFVTISAVVLLLGTTNVVIARFEPYFGIFLILLLPNVLMNSRNSVLLRWTLMLGSLIYFGFYILSFNGVVPYRVIPELTSMN
ncbi:EpsG family protein [Arthrobacter oryzae]|uniref:EpsG family protein n=1 Tax=Arthrobacter oryzae TaxID=409290 RepID=UPI00273AE5A6|nr:EpsG family protein [Arthrobacter oryzae]WLQ07129.1 EpsG family protein [Arthrobacter oryzae]